MSKYTYTTVYEEFTGLKPPEPKAAKPRRRRGYGHPYRMRLNMQDDAQQPTEKDSYEVINTPQAAYEKPAYDKSERQPKSLFHSKTRRSDPVVYESIAPVRQHEDHAPKVTYKKRRHYTMTPTSTVIAD